MTKRILYVEDAPQNMLLVKRILEALHYELLEARDGESGWQTAVAEDPDLILMDLRLPGELSGLELIGRMRRHPLLKHTPIVVLTAYGYDEVEQSAIDAGCDGFLRKPADISQIRQAIKSFLREEGDTDSPLPGPVLSPQALTSASYTFI